MESIKKRQRTKVLGIIVLLMLGTVFAAGCDIPEDVKCEKTGYEHRWSSWAPVSDQVCQRECKDCKTKEESPHVGGSLKSYLSHYKFLDAKSHQVDCWKCGHIIKETHLWGNYEYVNEISHKNKCQLCMYEAEEPHTYEDYESVDDAVHRGKCSKCDHVGEEEHNYVGNECTECNHMKAVAYDPEKEGALGQITIGNGSDWGNRVTEAKKRGNTPADRPPIWTVQPSDNIKPLPVIPKCAHQYQTDWSFNGFLHWKDCVKCYASSISSGEHVQRTTLTGATDPTWHWYNCSVCGHEMSETKVPHDFGTAWISKEAEGHYQQCQCGAQTEVTAHEYANDQDADCNKCGYTREVHTHIWPETWTSDGAQHWHQCTCGEKKDIANHTLRTDSEWDMDETQHWHNCAVCSEAIDNTKAPHDFGTAWISDGAQGHYQQCQCGAQTATAVHEYDNDQDADCNKCGYTREVHTHIWTDAWTSDGAQHWHQCTCGEKKDLANHIPRINSEWNIDETYHWYNCTVCGEPVDSTRAPHRFEGNWMYYNGEGHFQKCKCYKSGSIEEHKYDNAADPNCNVCGYTREPVIAPAD